MDKMIVRRLSMVSAGAAAQTVEMDAYPRHIKIEWDRFNALVVNGDATLIEIGVKLGVSEYILRAAKVTNVGQSITITSPCRGYGSYRPFARFTGTAAGETLEFYAFGRILE